jgi:Rhs element Vgr protein
MSERLIATDQSQDLVTFAILVDGNELPGEIQVSQIHVFKEVNRIPLARIVILDGDVASESFAVSSSEHFVPGKEVEVQVGYHNDLKTVFKGILVKQNIKIRSNGQSVLAVDCQDEAVKMTIGRKSKFFYDSKDSDIIEELIDTYSIDKTIQSTNVTHVQMVQYDATDWDFMIARAEANNMLCFVNDGSIEVKKADFSSSPVVDLTFGANIIEYDADLDSRTQIDAIKAYSWDQGASEIIESEAANEDLTPAGNLSFSDLAGVAGVGDESVRQGGQLMDQELQKIAENQQQRRHLSHMKGRVKFQGVETVLPGAMISINGVGERFIGNVFVSGVRHSIHDGDWKTQVQFGLDHQLFSEKFNINTLPAGGIIPAVYGLQIGLVSQLEGDPDQEERIMVKVPLIDAQEQGIWARVALPDAGDQRTIKFLPEIGDEVLVGFINDDPRKAVVLGALHSSARPCPIPHSDDNHIKGFVSRSEMKITFDDEKSILTLETPGGHKIAADDDDGSILLEDSNGNKILMNSDGITLESAKDVILKATGDLKTEGVNIESKASASYKAEGSAGVELSSSATMTIKGSLVQIN